MAKLDRLGWAAGECVDAYGVRVGLRVNKAEALDRLLACLPAGWKRAPSPAVETVYSVIVGGASSRPGARPYHRAYADGARIARTRDWDRLLFFLESELELHVGANARRRTFVHAGVVGWNGRAVLIPGATRSGKTTLVAALLRAGATYLSDEFALLDRLGRVHPYPRPLNLRGEGGGLPRRVPAEALGGRTGRRPLPVGLVLLTEFRPGARWRPRRVTPGRAALALLQNTVSARRHGAVAVERIRHVVGRAPAWAGPRGDAGGLIAELRTLFEREISHVPDATAVPAATS